MTDDASTYPVVLDLRERRCLVVGGGRVAGRKTAGLLAAGARVFIVAPRIEPTLAALRGLELRQRPYRSADLTGKHLVITCTNDPKVNAEVARDAEDRGIWVNSADDPANCTFTLPAVARSGDLTVAVSTNGTSPALAGWLRARFERQFDSSWAMLLELLAEVRAEARLVFGTSEVPGWDAALDAGLVDLIGDNQLDAARSLLRERLGLAPSLVPTGGGAP